MLHKIWTPCKHTTLEVIDGKAAKSCWSKMVKTWTKSGPKVMQKWWKSCQKLATNGEKIVKKVLKKWPKSCPKVVKKYVLVISCLSRFAFKTRINAKIRKNWVTPLFGQKMVHIFVKKWSKKPEVGQKKWPEGSQKLAKMAKSWPKSSKVAKKLAKNGQKCDQKLAKAGWPVNNL